MKLKYKLRIYKDMINGLADGSIQLTDEQFAYLKELGLVEGKTIGLHNTAYDKIDSFFETGLYNNRDYLFAESCDLSNTVAYSEIFSFNLFYCQNGITTIILMLPDEVLEGKRGIFERLQDGGWGIPPEYIIGAFKGGKIFTNKQYNSEYYNPDSQPNDEPEKITQSYNDKREAVNICERAFNDYKKMKGNRVFQEIKKRSSRKL